MQQRFYSNIKFRNQFIVSAIKFGESLSKFMIPKYTKYVTNIIAEPKYKYGQLEQVTVRNHNRSTALERSVKKYWGA